MEPNETKVSEGQNLPHKDIETNYSKHQDDPGPSPQAVNEYDKNGAGPILKWLIPILVIALLIYWLIFR